MPTHVALSLHMFTQVSMCIFIMYHWKHHEHLIYHSDTLKEKSSCFTLHVTPMLNGPNTNRDSLNLNVSFTFWHICLNRLNFELTWSVSFFKTHLTTPYRCTQARTNIDSYQISGSNLCLVSNHLEWLTLPVTYPSHPWSGINNT